MVDGESDFHAAMPPAFAFAAFLRLPSFFAVDSPAVLPALSGCLRRFCVLAAMLFWAALSDGYGVYACCVESAPVRRTRQTFLSGWRWRAMNLSLRAR